MAKPSPRQYQQQMVHYLRKLVNYNDTGIASGVLMGTIPAGAVILPLASTIVVTTAFNAGTTNNLLVGKTAGGNDYVVTADSAAGSTGAKTFALATVATGAYTSADQDVYVAYTQTGTAATTGVAYVVLAYAVNNDG